MDVDEEGEGGAWVDGADEQLHGERRAQRGYNALVGERLPGRC